ncbi:acyl-CoA thioesterase [Citricoccus zhacaiensis]|uniref:Acyl-CoA thioesterase n=1 Tax=Citricoccus zhacaiensis TaxID=489142 RepID=A0ABQ2LRU6_9MICC|nr:acyl-CoA thioesterase [Citricoccus zhacaiensis]GGO42554.1 acyl-CoA thioesterase [Citricoccus zhacaiensis]
MEISPTPAAPASLTPTADRRHEVTLRFLAAPTDRGKAGTVDAGRVLEWVDKAAFAAATGWSESYCVTAYVGNVHFEYPVQIGEMVEITATVLYTGRSSMHINTMVRSGDPKTGQLAERARCLVIFVAVDAEGHSTPVPEFVPRTLEQQLARDYARSRIPVRDEISAELRGQQYTEAGTAEKVVLRFLAEPTDVNWGGKVHGGIVMEWIDSAAYLCSSRYCGRDTVAVFSGGIRFLRPLHIGDLVEVEARLIYTGNKGMHIAVEVRSGDPKGQELAQTTNCITVMVARDSSGTSVPVPTWKPANDEDRRLWQHARTLLEIRGRAPGNRLPNHLLEEQKGDAGRAPAAGGPGPSTETDNETVNETAETQERGQH